MAANVAPGGRWSGYCLAMSSEKGARLLWHGVFLFLLGLLTGVVSGSLTNPRMGLSSHLEGVMNGLFLLALGLIFERLRLPAGWRTALFWLALYGTYVNWAATFLAAVFGTSGQTPIAGTGHRGAAWQEYVVDFGLYSLSVAMLAVCVITLLGLRRGGSGPTEGPTLNE